SAAALLATAGPAAAAPLLPTGNLLANPGAEVGQAAADPAQSFPPASWSPYGGLTQVLYGASGGFPGTAVGSAIGGGNALLAGGNAASSGGQQIFNITPAAAAIDAGRVRAVLSGALGGIAGQDDNATLSVQFDNYVQQQFGGLTIGPVSNADRANTTNLLPRTASEIVPAGTRRALVGLSLTRVSGSYDDGYADNLALVLRAIPIVHTTAADQVTQSSARISATLDDGGSQSAYRIEYGTTTAYGQRSADLLSAGTGGVLAVQTDLGGLSPGTDYHARIVADGPDGPVAGEDVSFRTAAADVTAPGLPAGLDFTWAPRADVLIAGAPVGGVQFQATAGPGVDYAWDFDFHDGSGFQPTASGDAPKRAFTADGAHDADRVTGEDGLRRRLYSVRLRATAANGATAEVTHDVVVMPNQPPKVDFTTSRTDTGVNHPVTFTPSVSDPDQGPRTADHVDHVEWDFDPPAAGGAPDLICAADGSACHLPDSAAVPGPWFAAGDGHQAIVNFFARGLAAHALPPLSTIDLDALPATAADGRPLAGAIGVRAWANQVYWVTHDPRLAYLYDNATLLQQSTFDLDAGEATGAALDTNASLRATKVSATAKIQGVSYAKLLAATYLSYRGVTLTAVDSGGLRTSVTHSVPLVPEQAPKLRAQFVNRDPNGKTVAVFRPGAVVRVPLKAKAKAKAAETTSQTIDYPLTTNDELAFDASGSSDPDGSISYYTLEVGKPMTPGGTCGPTVKPPVLTGGPISIDPPDVAYGPGEFFPAANPAGTGITSPVGTAGTLPGINLNPRGLQQAGFASRAQQAAGVRSIGHAKRSGLPSLGALLGTMPIVHPCVAYSDRNVIPTPFKVRGSAAARPLLPTHGTTPVPSQLLTALRGLDSDTTALVTKDPTALRFRIPNPGTYSVAVSAYDDAGLGATQRTDGFVIVPPSGTCQNIAGQDLQFERKVVFSGQCVDYGGNHRRFWTKNAIDVNGVTLRPASGSALYLQLDGTQRLRVFATTAGKPASFAGTAAFGDATLNELASHPGAVDVVAGGDPVARFAALTPSRAWDFIANSHAAAPSIPAGATYHGSPVARSDGTDDWAAFAVTFAAGGRSSTAFRVELPAQFSRGDASTSPTADVNLPGLDEPRSAPLETNTYADIAAKRRAAAKAHAAGLNLAATIDLSGTSIGPVTIVSGRLKFDTAAGTWQGDIDDALLALGPQLFHVRFHILIADGALKEASGAVSADPPGIQIFSGVFLNEVRFSIVTDPLTVSGGATFSFLDVLQGDLDLIVRTDPVFLRLQGKIRLASLELGGGFVQYDEANSKALTFGGHFGYDFGPASLEANLEGGVSFETGDFYIQGGGHACMWICLDVQALASNIAVAGCGSVDLFVTTVSAGLAYKFGDGLDVFTGCDLEPYKPAIFRARAAGPTPVGDTLSVPPATQQMAFKFYGDPALPGSPKVTLTAPDGRVFTTAALPGDYAFSPPEPASLGGRPAGTTKAATALIDQDPVDHVSTVLVANPAAGAWHFTTAAGTPAPVRVEQAAGEHVPDSALQADVAPTTVTKSAVRIGKQSFKLTGARKASAAATTIRPAVVTALRLVPRIEAARLRGVVIDVPSGLTGRMTIIDAAPHGSTVVRSFDVATTHGKVPIAFDPSTEPGQHELRAFLTHSDGVPRQETVVDRFTAPSLPTPSTPGLSLHRSAGGTAYVDVSPGTAGSIAGPGTSFELVVVTSAGQRIERIVDGRVAHAIGGGRFRVQLGTIGGRTVKLSARMIYGAAIGRVGTDTVRASATALRR
ncbi:MAG: hypothetical protein JWQ18_1852, partial [Conexibacter sp.]|nr:hypothetical protein [Conexibacter sp.]